MLKFIYNKPALLYDETLILADLHIGIENEFFEKGVRIGKFIDEYEKEIIELIDETKCKRLVLLGDVKHSIPSPSPEEKKEIFDFLNELSKHAELLVVKGNHDGWLQKFVGDIKIYGSAGLKIKNISLNHGHSWPSEEMMQVDYLILAHNHPCVELVDKFGYKTISRVWVMGKLDKEKLKRKYKKFNGNIKIVVMPAFNELVGGLSFNRHKTSELLGPLFKNEVFKLEDAEIYLLNGVNLGKIRNLR